jgi:hypothetical protein
VSQIKINSITPAQAARFGEWSRKWIETGLSTAPADFDKAQAAALEAYKLCNLDKPMIVLRLGSPFAATVGGAIAVLMLNELFSKKSQVRSQVESQVRSQVESQVRSQVGSQVWSQVGSQVGFGLGNDRGGAFWASWCAYVSFIRDVLGWDDPVLERFRVDEILAENCGWVWWHENVLAISDNPEFILRDDQGRLHNHAGPAIKYRDGWSIYSVHGVNVPADIIDHPESITAKKILKEENAEIKRVMLDLYGYDRYLADTNAKPLSRDDYGELFRVESDLLPVNIVKVRNSTAEQDGKFKDYFLKGRHDAETAHEAVASTFGMRSNDYHPSIET